MYSNPFWLIKMDETQKKGKTKSKQTRMSLSGLKKEELSTENTNILIKFKQD